MLHTIHLSLSGMDIHDSFLEWLDLKSWHVGKDYREATNISVGHVADGIAVDLDFIRKIFEYNRAR